MTDRYPLYDEGDVRDACGVGFVAARDGAASHRLLRLGVACLHNLDHRGAKAIDGTGDGAGIMTRTPYRILERVLDSAASIPPPREELAAVMTFLPAGDEATARGLVEEALAAEGLQTLMWRTVPIGPDALSPTAQRSLPAIEQAVVTSNGGPGSQDAFERALFLARRAAERNRPHLEGFSIPSASSRTVVYKGLFTASRIEQFYWDLGDPDFETDFVVFHQRYSTNTSPSWALAQPFRMLGHNGEINTLQANRSWMAARSRDLRSAVWGERIADLDPLLTTQGSDSASLDEAVEVLVRSGRSLPHVKEMLIPAAWENVPDLTEPLRAFYEYHAFLTEPWDGPAAIAASDGRHAVAALDRNGLRPARWALTSDIALVASEAGVAPEVEAVATETGQLAPGEILVVDLADGSVLLSDEVKEDLAARAPYTEWIRTETNYVQDPFDDLQDDRFDADALSRVFGYTEEERRLILGEMAEGLEPLLSMGSDTGLAALAKTPQRLTRFFHQAFAQVTNPPVDPIRERLMMSLRTYVGRRGSLLEETPQQAHLMELPSAVLSDAELEELRSSNDPGFASVWIETLFAVAGGHAGMVEALDLVCRLAEAAVRRGTTILILSDREVDEHRAAIPMVLAVSAVHHHLIDRGLRLQASIVAVSGETRDAHDFACLIGFGASAVNPYLAIEQVRDLADRGQVDCGVIEAQERYRLSLENGFLKIMSKMGICTISAYRGSELFEAIGLDDEVCRRAFRNVRRRIGGVGFDAIARAVLERHDRYTSGDEEPGGFYKHGSGGEPHINAPGTTLALRRAVRSADRHEWSEYLDRVQANRVALELRDLVDFEPVGPPVRLSEVESVDLVMRRFTTAAMSLGALSPEAHETLAEAMSYLGGLSNSGEGGEDEARFGSPRNSGIKQVASGRFGVTPAYLASAEELQIKMAQGSKPGEGGQLPGHKVNDQIARLRNTNPGVTLISPPPHHDIYSIEDLAQLIYDLREFSPKSRVSVKLVSGPGVGTIAVGVAKAGADGILISGNAGGTGASPTLSIKHAGSPWEIGLAEAHQALVANGLRNRVVLSTDGGLRTGRDVVVAALLGADRFGFGTLPLIALGCKMVRQCHLNTCPVGITTQQEDLRAKFTGSVKQVINLFLHVAEDVRFLLAAMGVYTIDEVIGRADLLKAVDDDHPIAASFVAHLVRAQSSDERRLRLPPQASVAALVSEEGRQAMADSQPATLTYPIANTDRTVGTRLAGELVNHRDGGDHGRVRVKFTGTAGQSFGAFLTEGITLHLDGTANDYVGKGLGGGTITVVPDGAGARPLHGAGNACLYGATAGALYVAGPVGQRFAVRNSGASAVVEGASDHCCEYMTGGVVAVLGPVGRNAAAGMTGGTMYVWDPDLSAKRHFSDSAPPATRLTEEDAAEARSLVEAHHRHTGSRRAERILEQWAVESERFWVLRHGVPDRDVGLSITALTAAELGP